MPSLAPEMAAAELESARKGAALFEPTGRELVRVTGSERVSFVHGMVTCDVAGLAVGAVASAAFLNPKGGLVADGRVLRREGDVLLEVGPGLGGKLIAHLSRYLISEDAELSEVSSEWTSLSLVGPTSAQVAAAVLGEGVVSCPPLLPGRPGLDLWLPRERSAELLSRLEAAGSSLGLRRIGPESYEVLRVESGLPRYGAELDESTLVQEAGLEKSVNYQKGCYIGQEVVARVTFRGEVQRKLGGLLLPDPPPEVGASLLAGERKVGRITSVVFSQVLGRWVGLGYLNRDSLEPGTQLQVEGRGETTVHPLPFV